MTKVGTYVRAAHLFYQFEEMLHKNLDRQPNHQEMAVGLCMRPRMVEAIRLRFNKDGVVCMRLIEVASYMSVSIERVRQLLRLGLGRVTEQMGKNGHS